MNKINEVFTMPMSVDEFIEIANNDEIGTREIRCIVHSLNHVDALAEALEDLMEWHVKNVHILNHPTYDRASRALAAYRGKS